MCILGTIITKYYTWGVSRYLLGTFSFWMCISTLENCQYYRHFSYFNLLPPWCLMRRRILYISFLQNQSSIQALWSIFISAGLLSAVPPTKRLFYFLIWIPTIHDVMYILWNSLSKFFLTYKYHFIGCIYSFLNISTTYLYGNNSLGYCHKSVSNHKKCLAEITSVHKLSWFLHPYPH